MKSNKDDSLSLEEFKDQLDSFLDEVQTSQVRVWSFGEVKKFLEKINMKQYQSAFLENKINGKALLIMTEGHLNQMGIFKKGDILCILDSIKKVQHLTSWKKQKKYLEEKKLVKNVSVPDKIMSYYQDQKGPMVLEKEDDFYSEESNS